MTADYEFKFVRVTISGTMFNATEEWSTGFQLGQVGTDVSSVTSGVAEQVAGHWETFFENANHAISSAYLSKEVKCALINLNGTTDQENIDYFNFPGTVAGGQGGVPFPPQITLAATLTSDFQRGLASKGRMYIPGVISGIDSQTGKLGGAFTNTLNTGMKTMLDGINADADIPYVVVLASKGHKTATLDVNGQPVYENGRQAEVTGCRIGSVYDTQRRRRNGLTETYDTKVLA